MNKYIVKANELWRENHILKALGYYQKACSSSTASTEEKNIANHMCAYLYTVIARRSSQESAFMGVDLRSPYQDNYYQAGLHLAAITGKEFYADDFGLPVIDAMTLAHIEEAYAYQQQLHDVYMQAWHMRVKAYCQTYMYGLLNRVHQRARA